MHVHVRCAKCEERRAKYGLGTRSVGRRTNASTRHFFSQRGERGHERSPKSSSCVPLPCQVYPTVLHRHGDAYTRGGLFGLFRPAATLPLPTVGSACCIHDVLHCAADSHAPAALYLSARRPVPLLSVLRPAAQIRSCTGQDACAASGHARWREDRRMACAARNRVPIARRTGGDDGGGSVRRERVRDRDARVSHCAVSAW